MQAYTELTPPTAVTHAIHLPFLSSKANNLVVAKTSLLQIFELKPITTEVGSKQADDVVADSPEKVVDSPDQTFFGSSITLQRTEHTTKLALVAEYPLSGTVISLASVKLLNTRSGGEALLLAFRDAKLSLVEWDPEYHGLSTVSIHYYEGEELQTYPWAPDLSKCHNFLSVDPSSRCAALKFGARNLAILPFRQLGDDLAGDDYGPDLDDPMDQPVASTKITNGDDASNTTPYLASFVLPLTALDPTLTHPIHFAFLYEYREPTFGIISSSKAPAVSLLHERRDPLTYSVFTLDLEQRASTTLLSVSDLPFDISRVIPLPLPVGGALLVGGNELVHVDQAGKTNAVAVNEFAKQCSSFPISDQSDLGLKLEGCTVEQLGTGNGDLLVVLNTGELAILSFKLDGRTVSGLSIQKVSEDRGGLIVSAAASCAANLGRNRIFLGSEDGDSVVLGWTRRTAQLSRKRSHAEMLADDADVSFDEDDIEDDDDIYATTTPATKQRSHSIADANAPENYTFRIHDTLLNIAPLRDVTFGTSEASLNNDADTKGKQVPSTLELVAATGRDKAGDVAVLKREIEPTVLQQSELPNARALWTVHAKKPPPEGLIPAGKQDSEAQMAADADYDQFLIVSRASNSGEESAVFSITESGLEETKKGEFETDGATIDVGTLAGGTRIVQVMRDGIRSYDSELGLSQIIPMEDEVTGADLKVISASFCDPYLLVLRDDSSVAVLEADDNGDIDLLERGDALLASKWLSGCIYKSSATNNKALVYLLSAEGGLHIFEPTDLDKPAYIAGGLSFLPSVLTADYVARRTAAKEALTEILVADIGDAVSKLPYLIARTSNDDLVLYQAYHYHSRESSQPFTKDLRWLKISQPHLAKYTEEPILETEQMGRETMLRALSNVNGYSTVFQCGTSPSFVLKESSSAPRVLNLRGKAVKGLSSFHTDKCSRGFSYIDADSVLRTCTLPQHFRYGDTGWAVRKIGLGQEVDALCYYPPKGVYVLGTSEKAEFKLPEDDYHHEWSKEDTRFLPQTRRGMVKVLHPATWSIIDAYELDASEVVLCMKTLDLEISEETHARKPLIGVGTALIRGEDLPARGCIYIFEVITVVPEPGRPETNRKLKLIVKEEVKGAVTALSEIGTQGFLLMAQGQKCMVRGLKEDGTLLPVAFMDVQCYVTVVKELKGTGMVVMGDAAKGVWFTGYREEPYKMILFGKSRSKMEVMAAEFLPYQNQLYIIVADADCNIHVLQFDPEHPKSLSGQRLLHKSTFHTGHFPTTMTLLPSTFSAGMSAISNGADPTTLASPDNPNPNPSSSSPLLHQILTTTHTGALTLLTPVAEPVYRRLTALQTFLTAALEHACGLNPRAYRAVESEGFGSRGVVDAALLGRWAELGSHRRAEACAKLGVEEWVVRSDLEAVGGAGVGFL